MIISIFIPCTKDYISAGVTEISGILVIPAIGKAFAPGFIYVNRINYNNSIREACRYC